MRGKETSDADLDELPSSILQHPPGGLEDFKGLRMNGKSAWVIEKDGIQYVRVAH